MSSTSKKSGPKEVPSRKPARSNSKYWFALAGVFVLFLLGIHVSGAEPIHAVPGHILIKPRGGISESRFTGKVAKHQGYARRLSARTNVRLVHVAEGNVDAALAELKNDPEIEFAERDYFASASFVPNDPLAVSEWHLAKIQSGPAWDISTGASNVIVAVLDSGVSGNHPDLAGKILPGYNFVWNTTNSDDDFGHGTAVAGTIVATGNNGTGLAGVAWNCQVLPVKVMDATGLASHSAIAQGIEFAVANGARIINLSMGGDTPSSTLQDAINFAWSNNVVVVASSGNTGGTMPQYPAACDHVVAVGATDQNDARAWFSTYGSFVTLAAPGVGIWTTTRDLANPYAAWSGTSFSSPIVAGVAALIASVNPALSNSEIVNVLKQSADDIGAPGNDPAFGAGRVNAYRALALVSTGSLPMESITDTNTTSTQGSDTNSTIVTITNGPTVTTATLSLTTVGAGTVSPNLNNLQLEVGKTYTVRATPGHGQEFAGWQGVAASSRIITFTMESNLALVATFVPSPFPNVRGNYTGLASNNSTITPENSGAFNVTITSAGSFSGKISLAGVRYGFHGKFDLNGDAFVTINRNLQSALNLRLHIDLNNPDDEISGTLSDGNWSSALSGDRNVYNSQLRPARQAGTRSFKLSRTDQTEAADGLSRIALNGSARVRGVLVDGRSFVATSAISKTGDCPFYLSLNHGTEVVIGWLNFPASQGPSANGTVLWVKSGTNSFAATLQAASAPAQ